MLDSLTPVRSPRASSKRSADIGPGAQSPCLVKTVCGLCIGNRTMTDIAMTGLFKREGCAAVPLSDCKIAHFHNNAPAAQFRQAVLCVIERELRSPSADEKTLVITGMRTMRAKLVLSQEVYAQLLICCHSNRYRKFCFLSMCLIRRLGLCIGEGVLT